MRMNALKWLLILLVVGVSVTLVDPKPSYGNDHFEKYLSALKLFRFKSGAEAPNFTLKDEKGGDISLADYEGKVIMLNFWATWCGPCRTEMPDMVKLYDKYKERGFVILALDQQEDARRVISFRDEYKLNFPLALDRSGRIGLKYGVRSLPTTYIIDSNGRVLAGALGIRKWNGSDAHKLIESLLDSGDDG